MEMQDVNTERFYAFERAARAMFEPSDPQDLELGACIDLIQRVFTATRHPQHPVAYSGSHWENVAERASCTLTDLDGPMFVIGLPPKRRRPWAALHEAAHALTWHDGHGPLFAMTCIELWVMFGRWNRDALTDLAQEFGVGSKSATSHAIV